MFVIMIVNIISFFLYISNVFNDARGQDPNAIWSFLKVCLIFHVILMKIQIKKAGIYRRDRSKKLDILNELSFTLFSGKILIICPA